MTSSPFNPTPPPGGRILPKMTGSAVIRCLAVSLALGSAARAHAQDVVMAGPQEQLVTPATRAQDQRTNQSQPDGPPESPFIVGPVILHPHLSYRYLHTTGLLVQQGLQVTTDITTLSPGLLMDFGKDWTVDYTPTWTYYSTRTKRDTLDHALNIRGATTYEDWAFEFSESYNKSAPTLIETAQQTDQVSWATLLSATYNYGPKLSLQTIASLNELYSDTFPDSRDWASMNWVNVKITPQVETALGFGLGFTDVVGGADLKHQQYLGRVNWNPADKLKFSIQGGMDLRRSESSTIGVVRNPILQATLDYQLLETTKLTLAEARTVVNSYFRDEVTSGSQWSINLQQRLLGRLFLTTGYSHRNTTYSSVTTTNFVGRSDRSQAFSARLTTQLLRRLTLAVIYQNSRNSSNISGFGFSSTQFGVEVGCKY